MDDGDDGQQSLTLSIRYQVQVAEGRIPEILKKRRVRISSLTKC